MTTPQRPRRRADRGAILHGDTSRYLHLDLDNLNVAVSRTFDE